MRAWAAILRRRSGPQVSTGWGGGRGIAALSCELVLQDQTLHGGDLFQGRRVAIAIGTKRLNWIMKILALFAALFLAMRAMADDAQLDEEASTLKFTGHAFLHDFHGEAKECHGAAQIDPTRPELVHSAFLKIMAAKMTTFEDARDHNMETWLNVTANPVILFELTKV